MPLISTSFACNPGKTAGDIGDAMPAAVWPRACQRSLSRIAPNGAGPRDGEAPVYHLRLSTIHAYVDPGVAKGHPPEVNVTHSPRLILGGITSSHVPGTTYASTLSKLGRHDEAIEAFEGLLAKSLEVRGPADRDTMQVQVESARALIVAGQPEAGLERVNSVTETIERGAIRIGPRDSILLSLTLLRAHAYAALGQPEETIVAYEQAYDHAVNRAGAQSPRSREVAGELARLTAEAGRQEEAARWRSLTGADDLPAAPEGETSGDGGETG